MRKTIALLTMLLALGVWTAAQAQGKPDADDQARSVKAPQLKLTHGPVVEGTAASSATIAWSTNANASTILKYGTNPNNLDRTAEAPWGGVTHRVHLRNLQPNTTYYFRVESTQAQGTGTQAVSGTDSFKTKAK